MRRPKSEINVIKTHVKQILNEQPNASLATVDRLLQERHEKHVSDKTLASMVSEIKTEIAHAPDDSTIEYDDNPEIIEINLRIETLKKDFKNAESVSDRCKLSGQLDSAQKARLELKKILSEIQLNQNNVERKTYIIKFGEPQVIKKPVEEKNRG